MSKFKGIFLNIKRLFFPPYWIIFIGVPLASHVLVIIFTKGLRNEYVAYISYVFSAYMLIAFLLNIYQMKKEIVEKIINSKAYKMFTSHSLTQMFLKDIVFRGKVSLYQGMFMNLMFAGFKLITSWLYKSVWFGAVAVYYISLSIIRFILARYIKKAAEQDHNKVNHEYRGYRICGYLMLFLNIAMAGMVFHMVWENQGYEYPEYIIYVFASYSFYAFTISLINIIKYSRLHSPLISASKILSFSGTLMSILALQTAMITQFGGADGFRRLMNSLVGGGICLTEFGFAIYMIVRGSKKLMVDNNS